MRKNLGALVAALLFAAPSTCLLAQGSTNAAPVAPSTNAPAATVPAATSLANVVAQGLTDSATLQQIQAAVASDQTTTQVQHDTPVFAQEIDQQVSTNAKLLASNPTLAMLRSAQDSWQDLSDRLEDSKLVVTKRISQLDENVASLKTMAQTWQATRVLAQTSAAPPALLSRIDAVMAAVSQTTKAVTDLRARILSAQVNLVEQEPRIKAGLAAIQHARADQAKLLFVRDNVPVWSMFTPLTGPQAAPNRNFLFSSQYAELRLYVAQKFSTLIIHLIVFILLALALFFVRRAVQSRAKNDPAVQQAGQVFEIPMAMAALLALLLSGWLYPQAPSLFWALLGAAALIPAVLILRRLIEPALFPVLYALVVAYFVDQLRPVAAAQPVVGRSLFLFEMLAAIAFLAWLLRSRRLSTGQAPLLERVVRAYAWLALVIFTGTALAQMLGYTHLSYLTGNGMLESSYLAVIFYAAVRIVDGLVSGLLKMPPFSLLSMVRNHDALIAAYISIVVRAIAFLFWLFLALDLFSVGQPLWNRARRLLTYADPQGQLHPAFAGRVALFALTIWAMFLVSRFIRFVLKEEVYPNLRLAPGVPYAVSTMVHYVVLIVGCLFALNALGIDLSKYSVLAGALGVGLGFGLQNIMNNFVSGIILLFERPIKVGDVIQVDTAVGTVESIGIRASVIRITNGSEIIMPNGNLISNQVINWTFSNRQRVIDIAVAVAPKSDPQQVIELLITIAKAHPLVLKEPVPTALFTSFTAAALNFELHAWTNNHEAWTQIRSDLSLAITSALTRENIAMA